MRFLILFLFFSVTALGATFENHFLSFQKPIGWECEMQSTEWVCQPQNPEKKHQAMMIFAAKIRAKEDSLSNYSVHLKKRKTIKNDEGDRIVSSIKWAKTVQRNGQNYVDSLHYQSEIPGYYTRYLATVVSDMGIVITFSVKKPYYSEYKPLFESIYRSLRVFNKRSNFPKLGKTKPRKRLFKQRQEAPTFGEGEIDMSAPKDQKRTISSSKSSSEDLFLYLILLAIPLYIFMRKRGSF